MFTYGPADATAIHKPHHLLPQLNPDCFYLSYTGLPRLSWKKRPLNGCSSSVGLLRIVRLYENVKTVHHLTCIRRLIASLVPDI